MYLWRPERNYTAFSCGFSAVCQVIHLKGKYINAVNHKRCEKRTKMNDIEMEDTEAV